ncbi:MAG: Pimeloyl-ACP methyl ester carboxylesterase [Chloroflexi bacterium]|nr:MAG: Pimeloyl-ACP methyl ester carboxylesterase [Chloroflexota bacterium]
MAEEEGKMEASPFRIKVPGSVLQDLRRRLDRTRWPAELQDAGWDYGASLGYIQELAEYWRTQFDWRAQERALNAFRHFRASVEGHGIHFIHERGRGPNPFPIVLTHGWPSTFLEMLKMVPFLTDPESHGGSAEDAFDVVVPSLPGFGFSDHPTQRGVNASLAGDLWARLMTDALGYQRFGACGGDIGARVTARLGFAHAKNVVGIHLNSLPTISPYLGPGARPLSEAEQAFLQDRETWLDAEGGYSHIQRTKPQTLAHALNDSPAGLAAWIVEKFRSWSDCDGEVERRFTKDELLTNITIYWVTQTITSSVRIYYESQRSPWRFAEGDRIEVPSGFASFPAELNHPPREWAERLVNLQRWTDMPRGGHFAAWEEPELLAEEIREFFRPLRGG